MTVLRGWSVNYNRNHVFVVMHFFSPSSGFVRKKHHHLSIDINNKNNNKNDSLSSIADASEEFLFDIYTVVNVQTFNITTVRPTSFYRTGIILFYSVYYAYL